MRTSRQVLAVVVVTTALCADHVAGAGAAVREPLGAIGRVSEVADLASGLAGRFVTRLSRSFQRTVPAIVAAQSRQPRPAAIAAIPAPQDLAVKVRPQSFTPFSIPPAPSPVVASNQRQRAAAQSGGGTVVVIAGSSVAASSRRVFSFSPLATDN